MARAITKKKIYKRKITISKNPKIRSRIFGKSIIPNALKIHIDELIKIDPPDFNLKLKTTFFYYLIANIIKRQNTYENKELYNIPVSLCINVLRELISNPDEYIKYLEVHNIIFLAREYSVGKSCRKYCFTDFAMSIINENTEYEVVEFDDLENDNVIVEKLIQDSMVYKENEHLLKWFDDKLTIDYEEAKKYIDRIVSENKMYDLSSKKMHWMNQINAIKFKVFYATRNEESDYRLHTNFTNFKKMFKKFISYDNKKIVGFDLKNSQPFFMIFLIQGIINNKYKIIKILNRIYRKDYINTFMLQKIRETLYSSSFREEYLYFKKWALNGEIYEKFIMLLNPKPLVNGKFPQYKYNEKTEKMEIIYHNSARDLMKSVFFILLFSGIKTKDTFYKQCKDFFPTIIKFIEIFKLENNANYSRALQNIESECVIDFITKKIAEKYPEMPLFTIHDSIATTEDYAKILKKEMTEYIFEFTGFVPRIEEEKW